MKAVKEREKKGGPHALDLIARAIVDAALAGNMRAAQEIGDRLDGKPAQNLNHSGSIGVYVAVPVAERDPIS
jgi:hypothetical protein